MTPRLALACGVRTTPAPRAAAAAPQWVMVSLTTDKPMCYSGNEAPCAYGELISIGAYA